jgi:hypothetical protein
MDGPDVHKHLRCIRQTWGGLTKKPGPLREALLGRPLTACAVAAGVACRAVALTQTGLPRRSLSEGGWSCSPVEGGHAFGATGAIHCQSAKGRIRRGEPGASPQDSWYPKHQR